MKRFNLRIGVVVARHVRYDEAAVSQVKTKGRRSNGDGTRTVLLRRHLFHAGKNAQSGLGGRFALFIPHGPHDYARMIAVATNQILKLRQALGIRRHHPCLIEKEHSQLIACIQKLRRRRIMRASIGVATHVLQRANTEDLRGVRQSHAQAGVILVIAGAFDLHRLAVEKEAQVRIETNGPNPKRRFIAIDDPAAGVNLRKQRVEIAIFQRPQGRGW